MRRALIPMCLLFSVATVAQVVVNDIVIRRNGDKAEFSFNARVDKDAVRRNRKLFLEPVIYDRDNTLRLSDIVIESRQSRIIDFRNRVPAVEGSFLTGNGKMVSYKSSVDYQDWFMGASLRIDKLLVGCNTCSDQSSIILASGIDIIDDTPVAAVEPVEKEPDLAGSAGVVNVHWNDKVLLVERHAPLPASFLKIEISPRKAITLVDNLVINFEIGSTKLDPYKFDNYKKLHNLITVLRSSKDILEGKIDITGNASPEGLQENNLRLAEGRALAVRNYILDNISYLRPKDFSVVNGGENWEGLRNLVEESSMPGRWQVLDIIDRPRTLYDFMDNASRKKYLMNLNGGETWRYMLLNFFPQLRNAASVTVYKKYEGGETRDVSITFPEQNTRIIDQAIDRIARKKIDEAMDMLTQIENDPRSWNPLGICYLLSNNMDKAREYLGKSAVAGYASARSNLDLIDQI